MYHGVVTKTAYAFLLSLVSLIGWVTPSQAQELLVNRSFETPVAPANGNNFYTTIANWTITNLTPVVAQPFNVIRPWSGYAGNPTATPTGGGAQYLDITSASGSIRQTITIPSNGMVDVSGWFSVRDFPQALSGLNVNIRTTTGTLVARTSTSFTAANPIGLWKQAASSNIPLAAGSYIFEVDIPNFANFDLASVVFRPALEFLKTSTAISDPVNGTTNPKHIVGGIVEYSLRMTSPAGYTVTSNSIIVSDATPANADLVVTDIGLAGSGPAALVAGSSGLTYTFTSLASATDNIDFSNNGGATWTYVPVANANGVDPTVTHVRVRPQGTMTASSIATVRLRYRVR